MTKAEIKSLNPGMLVDGLQFTVYSKKKGGSVCKLKTSAYAAFVTESWQPVLLLQTVNRQL
jgi:hypothetical protein